MTPQKKVQAHKLIAIALGAIKEKNYKDNGSTTMLDTNRIGFESTATIEGITGNFSILGVAQNVQTSTGTSILQFTLDSQFDMESELYDHPNAKSIIDRDLQEVQMYLNQYINED